MYEVIRLCHQTSGDPQHWNGHGGELIATGFLFCDPAVLVCDFTETYLSVIYYLSVVMGR